MRPPVARGAGKHREAPPDLVITDLMMPGMSGVELLKSIRADYPEIIVILVTAFGTVENAVEAMKAGAYDYITKPVNMDELRLIVNRGLEHLDLRQEVRNLRSSLDKKYGFENILGQSKSLLYVLDMASRAAQATSTVLIRGETGTGKELLAKAVHFNSRRKDKPFVTINCGAIPKDLLGIGAVRPRQGFVHRRVCEQARQGGTGRRRHVVSWTKSANCRWSCR